MTRMKFTQETEEKNKNTVPQVIIPEDLDSEMEYVQLNIALDEISECLDDLERRNAVLHKELSILLESNRQIRKEFEDAKKKL